MGVAAVGLGSEGTACLERIFALSSEFYACGYFPSAAKAWLAVQKCEARLFLIELALPDACGIWCARRLLAERPGIQVILVTSIRDALLLQRAAAVGIADLLVKPFTVAHCLARLRFDLCRSVWGSPAKFLGSGAIHHFPAGHGDLSAPHTLRDIEKEVLDSLAEGLMYKEIAVRIGRSDAAVRKLINGIYTKLEVHDRVHAVRKWHLSPGMENNPQTHCH
jgi:DNA-binding NarL/FixJ family response regulator